MSTMTSFFWAVYYEKRPNPAGGTPAKPQPEDTSLNPLIVRVYHRQMYSTVSTQYEVLRRARSDQPQYYRGDRSHAIEPPEFHPSEQAALAWMDGNWTRLQAAGATYAELHSFQVTSGQLADR